MRQTQGLPQAVLLTQNRGIGLAGSEGFARHRRTIFASGMQASKGTAVSGPCSYPRYTDATAVTAVIAGHRRPLSHRLGFLAG